MIEIIREESWDNTQEKVGLPKNIKQIGTPDIGERIYIENSTYQYIHPFHSRTEKCAYVLLGRFEEYGGRKCTFIEAAILLEEICFDGGLPVWNDDTWAYLYRKLKHTYDEMVIVGWAMDIQGQLPNLTAPLEKLHRTYFGGIRQLLFLMDSLDGEENFYTQKNGRLSRREGYYIYYDRTIPSRLDSAVDMLHQERDAHEGKENWQESQEAVYMEDNGIAEYGNENTAENKRIYQGEELLRNNFRYREEETDNIRNERSRSGSRNTLYRDYIREQAEKKMPKNAYTSTLLLAVVAIALGFAALHNYEKMSALEQTLAQMNTSWAATEAEGGESAGLAENTGQAEYSQVTAAAEAGLSENTAEAGNDGIKIEAVSGNVSKEGEMLQETESIQETDEQQQEGSTASQNDKKEEGSEIAGDTEEGNDVQQKEAEENNNTEEKEQTAETMSESQKYLEQGYYIVQEGESLVGICKKIYQTTAMMDKLCEVNGIENPDAIYAGQQLKLPN